LIQNYRKIPPVQPPVYICKRLLFFNSSQKIMLCIKFIIRKGDERILRINHLIIILLKFKTFTINRYMLHLSLLLPSLYVWFHSMCLKYFDIVYIFKKYELWTLEIIQKHERSNNQEGVFNHHFEHLTRPARMRYFV
jgi:hypothetical protein